MSEWVVEIDPGRPAPVLDHVSLAVAVDRAGGLEEALARLVSEIGEAVRAPSTLDDRGLLDAIAEEERLSRIHAARRTRLIAELHRRRPGDEPGVGSEDTAMVFPMSRWAPDELGLALSMSRLTAKNTLREAARLSAVFPEVLQAFEAGRIDSYRARIVHDLTLCLPDDLARAVVGHVLPAAGEQTYAALRAAVREAIMRVDPEGANRRHREERRKRLVEVYPEEEGMAALRALMPATEADAIWHLLTRLARSLDDDRTLDQRRADLVVDLLRGRLSLTDLETTSPTSPSPSPTSAVGDSAVGDSAAGHPAWGDSACGDPLAMAHPASGGNPASSPSVGGGAALVQVVVGLDTLTGRSEQPGHLVGYGPIPADLAREAALDGVWKRLVTDPVSGTLLDHGRTTYRPPKGLADFVRARDQVCRHPICRRRAIDSELDHRVRWADGGHTSAANLVGHCKQHNLLKEQPGWEVVAESDGTITWVTPTGHEYSSRPHDYRPFTTGREPPDDPPLLADAEDEPPF